MNYALVKCSNNEMFLGKLLDSLESTIILENPLRVNLYKKSSNEPVCCGFSEWNELSNENLLELNRLHILYMTKPRQDVIDYYLESLNYFLEPIPKNAEVVSNRVLH